MSLTSHIEQAGSPVRAFFERELGDTRAIVTETNRVLRGGTDAPPLAGAGEPYRVGTAADILLNAWLDPRTPPARFASAPTSASLELFTASQTALMEAFSQDREPGTVRWPLLARHALLLSAFVTAYRSTQGQIHLRESIDAVPATFEAYAARLWSPADEADLERLMPAVFTDLASLQNASQILVNPTFELSARLGGADADVIAGGTIWDYKSTRTRRIVSGRELWQLVGYLLADTHDALEVDAVGIAALRWRTQISWRADDLLTRLAGGVERPIAEWRAAFAGATPAR